MKYQITLLFKSIYVRSNKFLKDTNMKIVKFTSKKYNFTNQYLQYYISILKKQEIYVYL